MCLRWGFSEQAGLQQTALVLEKQPAGRRERQQQGAAKKKFGDLAGKLKQHQLLLPAQHLGWPVENCCLAPEVK